MDLRKLISSDKVITVFWPDHIRAEPLARVGNLRLGPWADEHTGYAQFRASFCQRQLPFKVFDTAAAQNIVFVGYPFGSFEVAGRIEAFDDAIHKLLMPERLRWARGSDYASSEQLARDHGLIVGRPFLSSPVVQFVNT